MAHDMEPTVFGLRTRTERLSAFVNSYPIIWVARFVFYAKLLSEKVQLLASAHDNGHPGFITLEC